MIIYIGRINGSTLGKSSLGNNKTVAAYYRISPVEILEARLLLYDHINPY